MNSWVFLKSFTRSFSLPLIVLLASCGGGQDEVSPKADEASSAEIIEKAAVTPKTVCIGDFGQSIDSCYKGLTTNSSSVYQWQLVTGPTTTMLNGSMLYTRYANGGNPEAAKWSFKTTVSGDIWFSAFIPGSNATTRKAYYTYSCNGYFNSSGQYIPTNTLGKSVDQFNSSGWITLGNLGEYPAGTSCEVKVVKLGGLGDPNTVEATSKLGVDGIKLTIY